MQLIATDNNKVVVGLGVTGLSCARYLSGRQQPFTVVDSREQPPGLAAFKGEFPDVGITLGAIDIDDLSLASELVVSPGVSLQEPAIAKAIEQGVPVCGDIDLFRREVTAPIVAITGSNGKSTVTTLVGLMAEQAGRRVAVGGNIGIPALDLISEPEPDFYVLELSSFQLERVEKIDAAVATVLNISADHMDRYDSLVDYHQAKHRIFFGCRSVVVNRADSLSRPLVGENIKVTSFGQGPAGFNCFSVQEQEGEKFLTYQFEQLLPVSELKIFGSHNIDNALAALAIGHSMGLPIEAMLTVLRSFKGLPHRCQFVAESAGVKFYNDSKGTNVGAAIAAVNGLAENAEKIVLIAGGEGKAADFSPLKTVLAKQCRSVVLIGEAADALQELLGENVLCIPVVDMAEAVRIAFDSAEPGDAVLLSPACASFDMFDDYQQRGDIFTRAVQQLINEQVSL